MEQLFGAIPVVLDRLGPHARVDEAVVFAAWSRCAGDSLRKRTSPLGFFENRLIVAVQDGMWRRHLEDLSPRMLVKMNGSLGQGTVLFIEFRIDEKAIMRAHQRDTSNSEARAARIAPSLVNAAAAISDESLRAQFLGAAASYLAKQKVKSEKDKK